MSSTWATINKILPFSCVDGPGNRLVIFFQGCNFNCVNCHNPYTINLCKQCGECAVHCPHQALFYQNDQMIWQASACQQCDRCINHCQHQSSAMTQRYHLNDLIALIHHYRPFLTGITVSGGEATLQLPFIIALFRRIKADSALHSLSCLIDSNGSLSLTGWQKVLPIMDGAMIDLKAWDDAIHRKLTGTGNRRVKESIQYLATQQKLQEVRLLYIPEKSDLLTHIEAIAHFLTQWDQSITVRINAFHHHGVKGSAAHWPAATEQQVLQLAKQLQHYGIKKLLLPTRYL